MSTRERWIVYPLLFLTLGIVMRDKIILPKSLQVQAIAAEQIRCNQLQVDTALCSRLQAGDEIVEGTVQCEKLAVRGPNGRPTVVIRTDPRTKGGVVTTISPTGIPLICLQPTESGGKVITFTEKSRENAPETPKTSSPPSLKQPSTETPPTETPR
jgi:hypothetical protein